MYVIGKVYIWQNLPDDLARLNGTETTVTGPPQFFTAFDGRQFYGQLTDTPSKYIGHWIAAERGELRPKEPPTGEQRVLDLFKLPELETV